MELTIWSGLVQGAIFVLVGTGFTLTLLPSGALNFAQGALVVGGSYLAYVWLHEAGCPAVVAILLNVIVGFAVGVLCELITIRPLRRVTFRSTDRGVSAELLTTVGMAEVLTGLCSRLFGSLPLSVPFAGPTNLLHWPGVSVLPVQVVLVVLSIIVSLGLYVAFKVTRIGRSCRAIAEDREAAALRGINITALSSLGFGAAGLLAGLAAMAIGPVTYAIPTLADPLALGGFVALAIGGERSFLGVLIGGLIVGIASTMAGQYIGANYSEVSILMLLLVVFVFRPRGLATAGSIREV